MSSCFLYLRYMFLIILFSRTIVFCGIQQQFHRWSLMPSKVLPKYTFQPSCSYKTPISLYFSDSCLQWCLVRVLLPWSYLFLLVLSS